MTAKGVTCLSNALKSNSTLTTLNLSSASGKSDITEKARLKEIQHKLEQTDWLVKMCIVFCVLTSNWAPIYTLQNSFFEALIL